MSDERDGADADLGSGDNETEETGGRHTRTAVATRPQRPTGKRSRQRVATEDDGEPTSEAVDVAEEDEGAKPKKAKKTKKTGKDGKPPGPNPIIFVFNYLKQVVGELRKVIWPNRKQMITYTSVVLAFLVFMVALVAMADLGLAKLVMLVFGNG